MDFGAVLFGLLVGGVGVYGVALGGSSLRRWRRISADDPVPIREAIVESGPAEVEGRARGGEGTLKSPLFGRNCVAYEYEIEERRRSGGQSSGSSWRTVDEGEDRLPFFIEDDSGTAYVDPEGASLSLESERTTQTDADGNPIPDEGGSWDLNWSINVGPFSTGSKRYTERRLDVDGHCYAFGRAERPPAGVDADVAIVDDETSTFLLSDAPEVATRRRVLRRGAGYALGGVAAVTIGLWLLADGVL